MTAGDVQIEARYPAPDVYRVAQGGSTRPRKAVIDRVVSARVRAGEQEHSNDFYLAYHCVFDVVAACINRLAAGPAKRGPNVRDVHRQWRAALSATLPRPLRAPVSEISPNGPWMRMVSRLNGLSNQRDAQGWHNMGAGFATLPDRRRHRIPDTVELLRILPRGRIGQDGSQERIDAAAPGLRRR